MKKIDPRLFLAAALAYICLLPFGPISRSSYLSENALLADYVLSTYSQPMIVGWKSIS